MPDSDENHSNQRGRRTETSRAASLLAAIACLAIARLFASGEVFHLAVVTVVVPLGFIWYGDEIGVLVGTPTDGEGGTGKVVGALITIAGWILLGAMLAIVILLGYRH
jgi:hypothetical protein